MMKRFRHSLAIAALICVGPASSFAAEGSSKESAVCLEGLKTKEKITLLEVMDCMKGLAVENDRLQTELAKAVALAEKVTSLTGEIEPLKALLQGAVIAFERSQRMGGACPQGWKLFEPAGGRFIVGAGVNKNSDTNGELTAWPSFGDDPEKAVGGEERHKLTELEMPLHAHGVYRHAADRYTGVGPFTAGSGSEDPGFKVNDDWSTGLKGGDLPHNTMPPFVALYYCIKE